MTVVALSAMFTFPGGLHLTKFYHHLTPFCKEGDARARRLRPVPDGVFAETRRTLLGSAHIRVETVAGVGLSRAMTPETLSPEFQVLFPLRGMFIWHLGAASALLNANQLLFVSAGDVSRDSHPSRGDADYLVLTPDAEVLESAWTCDFARLSRQPAFVQRVFPSDPRLQQAVAALAKCDALDESMIEEAVIRLLAVAAAHAGVRPARRRHSSRLVGAVKELISTCDGRLSLMDIGARLGASPGYLTDAFRRSEGLPISAYHRRLRLARALIELPQTDDLSELALRFGFSSHAHFTSAFKAVFGRTPSEYRARARRSDFGTLLGRLGKPAN